MPSAPPVRMAAKYRAPPSEFAQAMSESALEALIDRVRLAPTSRRAYMRNWAGVYHSAVPTNDGAFSHMDRSVFMPHTIEQIVAIVELAKRRMIPVRAVGRLHSPSDLPFSLGWTIRTDELDGVVRIDAAHNEVCVMAGTYISAITDALAHHEPALGFPNLGSISEQTIAGLLSTASHGSGIDLPVLSAHVLALDIVCPLAHGTQVVHCSRTEHADLFNASLCGLGATGVIVAVSLSVVPAFRLQQITEDVPIDVLLGPPPELPASLSPDMLAMEPLDTFLAHPTALGELLASGAPLPRRTFPLPARSVGPAHVHPFVAEGAADPLPPYAAHDVQDRIDRLVHSAKHVRFLWSPHAHMVTIDRASPTDAPADPPSVWSDLYVRGVRHVTQALLWASRLHTSLPAPVARTAYALSHARAPRAPRDPSSAPGGLTPVHNRSAIAVRVADAPVVFNFDCLFPQYTAEYAIPYEYTGAALLALRAWLDREHAKDDGVRTHFPVEVRFVDADGIWLSPSYGRRTCYIGLVQFRPYGLPVRYRRLFARFDALMRQFDGRPHWAKTHTSYRAELLTRFPHMRDWLEVVAHYDPQRVLVNPYVARHLLDEHASCRQSVFRRSRL